jgi:hypothetical protein
MIWEDNLVDDVAKILPMITATAVARKKLTHLRKPYNTLFILQ